MKRFELARFEPALLLILPAVWCWFAWSAWFPPNPDAYYHVGVATLYAEDGWVGSFPWLEYTTLSDFPNLHLLQHVVLAPIAGLASPLTAIRLSVLLLSTALAISVYLVLRRWRVPWPAAWTVLGLTAAPLLFLTTMYLKGASLFFVILVWFIDALWAGAWRRAAVLAWLSVYAYTGAPILLAVALVHAAMHAAWRQPGWWRAPAYTAGGLAGGLLVNPFWPDQWRHLAAELGSVFGRSSLLVPGDMRGSEWAALTGEAILRFGGAGLALWGLLLFRQLARDRRVDAATAAGALVSLGLLGASLLAGPKLFVLFLVTSVLFGARLAAAQGPWPRWVAALGIAAALASSIHGGYRLASDLKHPQVVRPADYEAMGAWLAQRTAAGEMVIAPWDDFPGLFLYDRHNHYVAGMNVAFLLDRDDRRFTAYYLLYKGGVSDPEVLLPTLFGTARLVLVRDPPRQSGDVMLVEQLRANASFRELASPSPRWRVFRLEH